MTESQITRAGQTAGDGQKTFAPHHKAISAFFNGTFEEFFDAVVTSDGATVTMTLEKSGGGDLTMNFSDGQTTLDCTPAKTIPLTPGASDAAPQENFVYILRSDKILTVDTSDWPAAEHIRVAYFVVPTASLVQTGAAGNNFVYGNQNWNDEAADTVGQGHLSHIGDLLRHRGAQWHSGCEGVATQDGNDLWVSIAAGSVAQVHHHVFAALDSDAPNSDPILVVNDPDGAYGIIHSLNEITKHSDGDVIPNNKYLKFVLMGVANKSGEVSPMMLNLPSEHYNTQADAETDVEGFANFTIPPEFSLESTTGFLVAAFVCQRTAAAMLIKSTTDLRGQIATFIGGAGTGGGDVTAAAVLTDNAIVTGDGGAKGVQTQTPTIGDDGVMSVPGIGDGGLTNYDLRVGNVTAPDYGMIQFGNAVMGRTSYNVGAIDLDGAIMVRNIGGPVTSEIEFIWTESAGNTCRFALPKSGVGNATYNSRSMLLAGPAPADTDFVKVSYWQGQGIFDNLVCDTSGSGADLGVQNDLEVEGIIYVDTIIESTVDADVTINTVAIDNSGNVTIPNDGTLTINSDGSASSDVFVAGVKIASDGIQSASVWMTRRSGAVGGAGLGLGHTVQLENAAGGAPHDATKIEHVWDVATDGSEDARTDFYVMDNGAFALKLTLNSDGLILGGDVDIGAASRDFTRDGEIVLRLVDVASAVDYLTISNQTTPNGDSGPILVPDGSTTNTDIHIKGKGTGSVRLTSDTIRCIGALDVTGIATASQLESDIAPGDPPLIVASTDVVANLNADQVDGKDETAFALLLGRAGGQTVYGGTGSGDDLNLFSTSHGTKGIIRFTPGASGSGIDEANQTLGIGTAPGSSIAILAHKAGTAKGDIEILKLQNTVTNADMDGTETSIVVAQSAHSSGVADLFRLTGGTLTDWTGTLSTQNSYFAIHTTEAGVTAERLRLFTDNSGHIHLSLGETAPASQERFLTSQADVVDSRWGNRSDGQAIYRPETHFNSTAKNNSIQAYRSRGTAASPSIMLDDTRFLTFGGWGYDGAVFKQTAFIRLQIDGTPASGDMPTEMLFYTGDTSAILRMTISPAGDVTIEGGDLIYEGDVLPSGGSSGLVVPSGTTPRPAIEGAIFLDTDRSANGSLVCYSNGAVRLVKDL